MNTGPTPAERAQWDEDERNRTHDWEHPREQHEAEDYSSRHFDFVVALTRSERAAAQSACHAGGSPRATSPITPTGGPNLHKLSDGTEASHASCPPARNVGLTGGAGSVGRDQGAAGPVDHAAWERWAWIPDEAA